MRDVVTMINTNYNTNKVSHRDHIFYYILFYFFNSFIRSEKEAVRLIQARNKVSERLDLPTLLWGLCTAGVTQEYTFVLTQTWAHGCSSLVLIKHYGAVFFYAGSVPGKEAGARCTELTQQRFLNKDQSEAEPFPACSYGILEWTPETLNPAASYWHINNTINLICYWVLRERLLAPPEQETVTKGEKRHHRPYRRAGGPSI